MEAIVVWLARRLWMAVMWLNRRPILKAAQRAFLHRLPEGYRQSARASLIRQNRFARRIGYPLMKLMMNLVIASILITTTFFIALGIAEKGYLSIPWRLKRQLGITTDQPQTARPSRPDTALLLQVERRTES